jgi:hypothetical protein
LTAVPEGLTRSVGDSSRPHRDTGGSTEGRKVLPLLSSPDCGDEHCMCIEEGIPSRSKGLILVTRRCCRCQKIA